MDAGQGKIRSSIHGVAVDFGLTRYVVWHIVRFGVRPATPPPPHLSHWLSADWKTENEPTAGQMGGWMGGRTTGQDERTGGMLQGIWNR